MVLNNNQSKQSKEILSSQIGQEGSTPPKFLTSLNYDKGTLDMAILQPKFNKFEGELKSHEYDTLK